MLATDAIFHALIKPHHDDLVARVVAGDARFAHFAAAADDDGDTQ